MGTRRLLAETKQEGFLFEWWPGLPEVMLWRNKRGTKGSKSTNVSQDQDPMVSPHLEDGLIGGKTYLYLLSLFPKKEQESLEGVRDIRNL